MAVKCKFWIQVAVCLIAFAKANTSTAQIADTLRADEEVLTFTEFMGYVKEFHPIVGQADLRLEQGEARLLEARGGFDPKIDVDYNRKKFKGTEYYDELNATFKIPTWYGVEFKAAFEENSGAFLDPSLTVPDDGLYSAGVSVSLAEGLLTNKRMATLRKAKFFLRRTKAERQLIVNQILFDASIAYYDWLGAVNEREIYNNILDNSMERLLAVSRSVEAGNLARIDSVEARIAVQNRQLGYEQARLKSIKARLALSTYLWIDEVPVLLEDDVLPAVPTTVVLENSLRLEQIADSTSIMLNHPKLLSLQAKYEEINTERRLQLNNLLPRVDLSYDFISPYYDRIDTFSTADYKTGLTISTPLFLRKERGALRFAQTLMQDNRLEQQLTQVSILNKVEAGQQAIRSLEEQKDLADGIVDNYVSLLRAEERKLQLGSSSIFLINSRESSLINAQLKQNQILIKQLNSYSELFNTLGIVID